jgi:hypothetical protein
MNSIQHGKDSTVISVEVLLFKEGDNFVAYCPALQLTAYDTTQAGVNKSFEVNMKIFLEETKRKGTFEKYLLKLGWTLRQHPTIEYSQPPLDKVPWSNMLNRKIDKVINQKVAISI